MSAALLANETIFMQVRRILVDRLERTGKTLECQPLSDENVHAIRKELKRVRAGLRLLRDAVGVPEYRRLNRALRDAARPLSLMRDASVLLQALDKLVEKAGKSSSLAIAGELRSSLQQQLCLNRTTLAARDIAAIRSRVKRVARSLQSLSDARLDQADVDAAIRRACKKARKAFKAAERDSCDDNLHEWRKQVKYELNQLQLLQPLKPKRISVLVRQAQKLADLLGEDHDLAVLGEKIAAQTTLANTAAASTEELLKALNILRAKLQRKAYRQGERVHASKPGKVVKHITKSPR